MTILDRAIHPIIPQSNLKIELYCCKRLPKDKIAKINPEIGIGSFLIKLICIYKPTCC